MACSEYTVDGKVYSSKAKAQAAFKQLLLANAGQIVVADGPILPHLLRHHHAKQKLYSDGKLKQIHVRILQGEPRIVITAPYDGDPIFSVQKCWMKGGGADNKVDPVPVAGRTAIQKFIRAWKEKCSASQCHHCNAPLPSYIPDWHADHYPVPFSDIFKSWLHQQTDVPRTVVNASNNAKAHYNFKFADDKVARSFYAYHETVAKLVPSCASCNLRRASKSFS